MVSSIDTSSSYTPTLNPTIRRSLAFIRHPPVDHEGEKVSATAGVEAVMVDAVPGQYRSQYGSGAPPRASQATPPLSVVLMVALIG